MGDAITNPSPPIRKIIQAIIVKAMPEAATPRYIQCTVTAPRGWGSERRKGAVGRSRGEILHGHWTPVSFYCPPLS